jgi:putative spermidine/putrescine transport system substrate-binding protein
MNKVPAVVLALLAAAFASVHAQYAGAQQQRFDGVTLRVGTFGGSWKDAVESQVARKVEALGMKVEYVIGNPAENFSKVVAARGRAMPIDVMELGPAEHTAMSTNDFLETIPRAQIANASKLPSQIVQTNAVAHLMIQNGIVYRADIFAAEKIAVPQGYGDLVNPKLAGRVAFPDVTNTQHWTAVTALAYQNGGNEGSFQKGFAKVLDIKPLYYFSAASELAQKFGSNDVIAAPWHAGWAVRLERAGQKVGFVHPRVGSKVGAVEYNYLGIVKGSKNVEAAAAFINAFLDTAAQTEFAKLTGSTPTNREARAQITNDATLRKFMLLTDKELENAFVVDWGKIDQQQWRNEWARTIQKSAR